MGLIPPVGYFSANLYVSETLLFQTKSSLNLFLFIFITHFILPPPFLSILFLFLYPLPLAFLLLLAPCRSNFLIFLSFLYSFSHPLLFLHLLLLCWRAADRRSGRDLSLSAKSLLIRSRRQREQKPSSSLPWLQGLLNRDSKRKPNVPSAETISRSR